jgi:hypothetical protein
LLSLSWNSASMAPSMEAYLEHWSLPEHKVSSKLGFSKNKTEPKKTPHKDWCINQSVQQRGFYKIIAENQSKWMLEGPTKSHTNFSVSVSVSVSLGYLRSRCCWP